MNLKKIVSSRNQESMVSHIVKKPHVVPWGLVKKLLVDPTRIATSNYLGAFFILK
jgi:hypothetical protein